MTENNKKKENNQAFPHYLREKKKEKKRIKNGVIYYNHNLNIISKYCMVHTTVKLLTSV